MTRISELVARVEGVTCTALGSDPDIGGVRFDSRVVKKGDIFAALVGEVDGHDYVEAAVLNGASAVLVERNVTPDVPQLIASNTRSVLGAISAEVYGHPSRALDVVGFTGTNGKTTCTYIFESILRAARRSVGVMGTVAYRWPGTQEQAPNTTPESAHVQRLLRAMVDDGVQAVAMEVSSHGLSTFRVEGTRFDVAVFTNFSQDHLDFHASMEAYREAKFSLFTDYLLRGAAAGKSPRAVVNLDSSAGRKLAARLKGLPMELLTFGREHPATIAYEILEETIEGSRVRCEGPWGTMNFDLCLLGAFNVENAMASMAAAYAIGVEPEALRAGLESQELFVPGRMQRVGQSRVFVDYAHSPDALSRACATLRPHTQRLVVVFGAGGDRDAQKRPLMGAIVSQVADLAIVTSDNPRHEDPRIIIGEILGGMHGDARVEAIVDRREAIRRAIEEAGVSGVVLIAGKGHETYQEVGDVRDHFDDVEEVRMALGAA